MPTQKSKFSKVIYNDGLTVVTIKKSAMENTVLQPRRTMRLENKVAEQFIKDHKDIVLYEDFLKAKEKAKKTKE